jgi:hypothetical protein
MATLMRLCKAIPTVIVAGFLVLVLVMVWPDRKMISRDIGCANVPSQRENEICQALSDSMEWTWMGHAIMSPGWRVTWTALRWVYCRERIGAVDLNALERMKRGSDRRLQDGADGLIRLVGSRSGPPYESENSIFNPANSQYILKDGCAGGQ